MVEQRIGQRFEAGFDSDLAFGAALGLIGQIQVFEAGFAVGGQEFALQLRGQFALRFNAFEDGSTTVFHLAQVAQALFQGTQLGVVQRAGDLFPVTGNKGHGGTFVQQGNGSRYLLRADAQFFGKAQSNGVVTHNNPGESEKQRREYNEKCPDGGRGINVTSSGFCLARRNQYALYQISSSI